jgi:hypothetical protein
MWVVHVRWRGRGRWKGVEECHGYDVAVELVWEYRDDGHKARLRLLSTLNRLDDKSSLSLEAQVQA